MPFCSGRNAQRGVATFARYAELMSLPRVRLKGSEIIFLPVLHGKLEFAGAVREHLPDLHPEVVAVEYPPTLREKIERGVKRLPYLSVVTYQERDGTKIYLLIEPVEPLIEAIRLGRELGVPVRFVDLDVEGHPGYPENFPDTYALARLGYERYVEEALKIAYEKSPLDVHRERTIAYHLRLLAQQFSRVVFVGGLAHVKDIMAYVGEDLPRPLERLKREGVEIYHLDVLSSREVLSEIGFFQGHYEKARQNRGPGLDRWQLYEELLTQALEQHREKNREEVPRHHLRVLRQFARNYALIEGRLCPDFYQFLVAARGAVNDDFAWEVWEIGTRYPFQTEQPDLAPLRISLEDLARPQRKLRFFRKIKQRRRRWWPVRKKPVERKHGEWKQAWKGVNICSFPPEDLVVEGFGRQVMKKALRILAEDLRRVEPFLASMKDGIDLRETIRHWYEGRIYVREERPVSGKVGSVVVIFDEDLPDAQGRERYPWKLTWHGEHDQESDMAFYATKAGEVVVGPGISRCHYGGFMLTYPPMRVFDIWEDPLFDFARDKAERLLLAAVDYSLEKYIVYIAKHPPTALAKSFAARQGKKILYLPLGQFSPMLLKKIQTFHVLEGHHVRLYAHRYIDGE